MCLIAYVKKKTRETDKTFKEMEIAVNRARKSEDEYVVSLYPDLQALRSDGIPQHRFLSEQAQCRKQLENNSDAQLEALVAETKRLQKAIEHSYPEAFKSIDEAIEKRKAVRQSLNDDPLIQRPAAQKAPHNAAAPPGRARKAPPAGASCGAIAMHACTVCY